MPESRKGELHVRRHAQGAGDDPAETEVEQGREEPQGDVVVGALEHKVVVLEIVVGEIGWRRAGLFSQGGVWGCR